ncbi:hypothetical protein BGZ76_000662 [Entomortierella beljakovae]|nr:hypothetical protein BGZ76_000662 [Entomortierella beljakovae]
MATTNQFSTTPVSPPLMPASSSTPSSTTSSPVLSSTQLKPQPINAVYKSSQDLTPSPKRGSIATHLLNFAARSTTSLNLMSSSAPSSNHIPPVPSLPQDEAQSHVPPLRSTGFSNPFKKLQNTFNSNSKKFSNDSSNKPEMLVSSSSSVNSMISWRSKGAEMLAKKNWGRARKNSEPTFSATKLVASPIFGAGVDDAVRMSHIPGTPMVPAVLFRCAEYLEAKGIDEVGLYRVPGSHASVQKLKKMFDSGKDIKLLSMEAIDPNDIATLLKLYLRELPSPLLPAVFLEQFQSVISTDRQVCHSLRGILLRLPRSNYVVLSFLCHHLSRIAGHSDKTKMNISNLAVVFAPTLSIGSILFKALLGGYYDTNETPESRENGLKIVWGGLLQDFDYPQNDWSDDEGALLNGNTQSQSTPHLPLTPAQQVVVSTAQVTKELPAIPQSIPTQPSPAIPTQPSPAIPTQPSPVNAVAHTTAEDDEAKLLAAMLLKEELAATDSGDDDDDDSGDDDDTASDISGTSGSIPCTDMTALSVVSSPGMNIKDQSSFASPPLGLAPIQTSTVPATKIAGDDLTPSPSSESAIPLSSSSTLAAASTYPSAAPTINITIDAGSLFSPLSSTFPESHDESPTKLAPTDDEGNTPHATNTTQQLPLEGLMIAL